MAELVELQLQAGSHLCDIRVMRRPDGTIRAELLDMDPRLIETTGGDVPERLRIVAKWVSQAAIALLRTARAVESGGPANDIGPAK